jgi:hypothetical protein
VRRIAHDARSRVNRSHHLRDAPGRSCRFNRSMWFGLGIIGVIIWVAIAFWPARVADRKGHSFFGYFVLSLFFFPLSLIMAYMVSDRTRPSVAG